jgi:chromosomal replication initiator protein
MAMAQHCLKHLVHAQEKRITIESIQRVVAEHYRMQVSDLKQKNNARRISEPRQIAMYLAKEMTGSSLPEIGRAFGGKHHTTVLHSIHKIERMRLQDPDLNRTIHKLMDSIG